MYSHSIMSSATDVHVKARSIPPQILGSSYAHKDLENAKNKQQKPTRNLMPMGRPLVHPRSLALQLLDPGHLLGCEPWAGGQGSKIEVQEI